MPLESAIAAAAAAARVKKVMWSLLVGRRVHAKVARRLVSLAESGQNHAAESIAF